MTYLATLYYHSDLLPAIFQSVMHFKFVQRAYLNRRHFRGVLPTMKHILLPDMRTPGVVISH